jgi:hypothetical protein
MLCGQCFGQRQRLTGRLSPDEVIVLLDEGGDVDLR